MRPGDVCHKNDFGTLGSEQVQTYADLAAPAMKGQVCMRSGSHPYNLSLGAAVIAHEGEAKAEAWAKGLVANFARGPKGGCHQFWCPLGQGQALQPRLAAQDNGQQVGKIMGHAADQLRGQFAPAGLLQR